MSASPDISDEMRINEAIKLLEYEAEQAELDASWEQSQESYSEAKASREAARAYRMSAAMLREHEAEKNG